MENAICYFFSFFVEAIILWQYASNLFVEKRQIKEKAFLLTCLYSFLFIVSLLELKWLNAVLYLIANFSYFITQYRLKWFSALFHSSMLTAVMSMCELILYGIISRYSPHFFAETVYFRNLAILTIFSKIMFFAIIYVLICFMKGKQSNGTQQDISAFLLGFIPITSVFVMLTFTSIGETVALSPTLDWMLILSAMFLLDINLLVFGLNQYNQKKNEEYIEMQLLLQKESDFAEYYKILLSQNDNQNILIHDIKKHLQSIDLLNEKHDYNKVSSYIQQLLLSSDLKDVSKLCNHELLNSILCRYQKQCNDLHISFLTDIRKDTVFFMNDIDLTSLFCNLLDNSIEACKNIPEAFIEINIHKRKKTPFVVITIINSCCKNPFSDQHAFQAQKLVTNKSDKRKHGFGMKSIHKVVNKYHGDIQMYFMDSSFTFHTIITLKQLNNTMEPYLYS
ncbi:MAG: GHKL domain-containing protein [Lachnospiraceae bacterium]|nr:GHKL domain-containing protein [Lachnospiraceae bacterium]